MDSILTLTIAGLASVVASLLTFVVTYYRRRSRTEIVTLRDATHSVRMTKANANFIDSVLSGSEAMSTAIEEMVAGEQRCIDVVGISLRGIVSEQNLREVFVAALKRNVRIRILLAHPTVARLREAQENRMRGAIAREVVETLRSLAEWRQLSGLRQDQFEIRLTKAILASLIVITSDRMLIKPYVSATAYFTPGFILTLKSGDERFQDFYREAFSSLWDQSSTIVEIATDPVAMNEQIDSLSRVAEEP